MTDQEAFSTALAGLRCQDAASIESGNGDHGDRCAYRNYKGLKCAAGMLIPDELYSALPVCIENVAIGSLATSDAYIGTGLHRLFDGVSVVLLQDLQSAHDQQLRNSGLELWEQRMEDIAGKYGLLYEAPDEPTTDTITA